MVPGVQLKRVGGDWITAAGASPNPAPEANQVAMDALLDWLETHGGEIFFQGPRCNLASVSDGVGWGPRFHGSCGRLLPFLLHFGRRRATDCNAIDGFVL